MAPECLIRNHALYPMLTIRHVLVPGHRDPRIQVFSRLALHEAYRLFVQSEPPALAMLEVVRLASS